MFMKYVMLKKRIIFPRTFSSGKEFIPYISAYVFWIVFLCAPVQAQTIESPIPFSETGKTAEVKLAEGLIVKSEDIENARKKADEVKAGADKSVNEIESFISNLENNAEITTVFYE